MLLLKVFRETFLLIFLVFVFLWILLPQDYVNILVDYIIRYYNLISLKFWQVLMYLTLQQKVVSSLNILCVQISIDSLYVCVSTQDIFKCANVFYGHTDGMGTFIFPDRLCWFILSLMHGMKLISKVHAYVYVIFLTLILHCVIK